MMKELSLQLGLTPESDCNYLPQQRDQLGIVMDQPWLNPNGYDLLISSGYRRSGSVIYKPMCKNCNACTPLRINCTEFTPSKSQKRQQNQLKKLQWEFKQQLDPN